VARSDPSCFQSRVNTLWPCPDHAAGDSARPLATKQVVSRVAGCRSARLASASASISTAWSYWLKSASSRVGCGTIDHICPPISAAARRRHELCCHPTDGICSGNHPRGSGAPAGVDHHCWPEGNPPTEARKLLLHDAQLWEQMADFEQKAYPEAVARFSPLADRRSKRETHALLLPTRQSHRGCTLLEAGVRRGPDSTRQGAVRKRARPGAEGFEIWEGIRFVYCSIGKHGSPHRHPFPKMCTELASEVQICTLSVVELQRVCVY